MHGRLLLRCISLFVLLLTCIVFIGFTKPIEAEDVNGDFQLQLWLNDFDVLTPNVMTIQSKEPVSIHIKISNFAHANTRIDDITFTVLLFGNKGFKIYYFTMGGSYNPGDEINETYTYDNPKIALGSFEIPLVTGKYRVTAKLNYSVLGPSLSWSRTKDVDISGGVSIIDITKVGGIVIGGAVGFFILRGLAKSLLRKSSKYRSSRIVQGDMADNFMTKKIQVETREGLKEQSKAFMTGVTTHIYIYIDIPNEQWRDLTVIMTEPNHIKTPIFALKSVPNTGERPMAEFCFEPGENNLFEGRITAVHRGRVLQTGVLKGQVVNSAEELNDEEVIDWAEKIRVRGNLQDIGYRREFDLAMVVNHASNGRPLLQAIAKEHAWLVDLSNCAYASDINNEFSKIVLDETSYAEGLNSPEGKDLLIKVAQIGSLLYGLVVEDYLNSPGNKLEFAKKELLQIVSTRVEALAPFEFIYELEAPLPTATICERWSLSKACVDCKREVDENTLCPMGFWGLSKVIERHHITPGIILDKEDLGKDVFLQSETARNRDALELTGTAVVSASQNVRPSEIKLVLEACKHNFGLPAKEAKTWDQWADIVLTCKPHVIIALPHTDGNGSTASLEIGGQTKTGVNIKECYVKNPNDDAFPLVALLGCDTVGTSQEYGAAVTQFRRRRAAIVIGTIAKVFGKDAAKVAAMLVAGLKQGKPTCVGEAMRDLKRQALHEKLLIALCVVAFGDADWKLN